MAHSNPAPFPIHTQNPQISDALKLCAETLLLKKMLSAETVEHLVGDRKEAILHMLSREA
jgi:hypothetical protein